MPKHSIRRTMGCAKLQDRLLPSVLLHRLQVQGSPHTRRGDVESARRATSRAHVLRVGVAHLPGVSARDELQDCGFDLVLVQGSPQARRGVKGDRVTTNRAHVVGIFIAHLPGVRARDELYDRAFEALAWFVSLLDRSSFWSEWQIRRLHLRRRRRRRHSPVL
jgi:F420-dependent methylenetetrahydromethanopterin dehydrogenase